MEPQVLTSLSATVTTSNHTVRDSVRVRVVVTVRVRGGVWVRVGTILSAVVTLTLVTLARS